MTYMTELHCPQCNHLIGILTLHEEAETAFDHTHVDDFLATCTARDRVSRTSSADLRARYVPWCALTNNVPLTPVAFGKAMGKRRIPRARTMSDRLYVGVRLI